MLHAHDLEGVSIRGRYAFALSCLERLYATWDLRDENVRRLIDVHWTYTSATNLTIWFEEIRAFSGGDPEKLARRLTGPELSADQLQSICHVLGELRSLGGTDMYQLPQSKNSVPYVLNVVGILLRWNVAVPELAPFARSRWTERSGYGDPVPRSFFESTAAPTQVLFSTGTSTPDRQLELLAQIETGIAAAEMDIVVGQIRTLTSPRFKLPEWMVEMRVIFRKGYSVEYAVPWPPHLEDADLVRAYMNGYCRRMLAEIENRFGDDIVQRVATQAKQNLRRKRQAAEQQRAADLAP